MVTIIKHLMMLLLSDISSLAHSLPAVIQMQFVNVARMPCFHSNSFYKANFYVCEDELAFSLYIILVIFEVVTLDPSRLGCDPVSLDVKLLTF
jgi:hypothetical protein